FCMVSVYQNPACYEILTLPLHDALPISDRENVGSGRAGGTGPARSGPPREDPGGRPRGIRDAVPAVRAGGVRPGPPGDRPRAGPDRKSTRLNSSHVAISYAVYCLKKKKE